MLKDDVKAALEDIKQSSDSAPLVRDLQVFVPMRVKVIISKHIDFGRNSLEASLIQATQTVMLVVQAYT